MNYLNNDSNLLSLNLLTPSKQKFLALIHKTGTPRKIKNYNRSWLVFADIETAITNWQGIEKYV